MSACTPATNQTPPPDAVLLLRRIERLEAALQRGRLEMAIAGHDLRQPLQIVSHAIDRLSISSDFWAAAARDQVERLTRGLAQLARASRGTDGPETPPLTFSAAALLDELEAEWRLAADHKGLRLRMMRSSALIAADRARLTTVIGNLVGNAIKHTERGRVVVGCRALGARLTIEVLDTGPGLDLAARPELMAAFTRGTSVSEGLGLGLWLVDRLCAQEGYALRVDGRPGSGTRFMVTVPRGA